MPMQKYSPYGYYLGRFLDAFQVCDERRETPRDDEPDAWEVSVMVRAHTPCEAYDRIIELAARDNKRYEGELGGISVEWVFKGITELEPILSDPGTRDDCMYLDHKPIRLADFLPDVRDQHDLCGGR
jgi:hypothetical protein